MSLVAPVTLAGRHVRLVPLQALHGEALALAVQDGELWNHWYTTIPRPEAMPAEIARRLDLQTKGSMCPFAVIDPATGQAVGMTTFMNIDAANRRVEIGSTWYRRSVQRTPLNTEAPAAGPCV
jgi:RimJ/RimL family protein N-acetyltransferase